MVLALQIKLSKTLPVRVMAWPELAPELANYIQFNHGITFVLFFIFFLLAVIGVMNTMLMAVFERTRELGMLMALGMRPSQVIYLIMTEATGLALANLVVGAALGIPVLWYLQDTVSTWLSHRRRDLRRGSGSRPLVVRPRGFSRLQPGRGRTRRDGHGLCALSGVASLALPADRSDSKGLAIEKHSPTGEDYWRNLWRNPRGTALTALALGLGLAHLPFLSVCWTAATSRPSPTECHLARAMS